jgi:hypothetical protein
MSIEFPFEKVDDVAIAFGGIPNYERAVAACPPEFYERNDYSDIARTWFHNGLDPEQDMAGYGIRADNIEDAVDQRRYVETWLRSFTPSHQEKMAVGGWLLSLMLVKPEES